MKVELFVLCDGAYNYGGRLTLVGVLDFVKTHRLPLIKNIGIGIRISCSKDERNNDIVLRITDDSGTAVIPDLLVNLSQQSFAASPKSTQEKISIGININGVLFKKKGKVEAVLFSQDQQVASYEFFVC